MSWSYDIEKGTITMTKGDTPEFLIAPKMKNVETEELIDYVPIEEDVFIFAAKKSKNDEEPLIKIEIPKETMVCKLKESDTKNLDLGRYIYEVSLNRNYGEEETDMDVHNTFVHGTLILTTEVY